ncbi:MAG: NUDIX hydrolase [Kiritimatiellia bacterium]
MTDRFYEQTLATERKYTGKIISVDLLDIELPDGRRAKREVVRHGNAVAILARRPDGKFVFVQQYRKAAEAALVEVIAGGLEPGEDPVEGAKRETAEETGYEVKSIERLTTVICTPGYCEERIHLYFAELSEGRHEQDLDPDENVCPVVLSAEEVEDGIRRGTIFDAKTLSAWLAYRLRA